jgi:hypothetical protein
MLAMQPGYLDLFAFNVEFEAVFGPQHLDFIAVAVSYHFAFTDLERLQIDVGVLAVKPKYTVCRILAINRDLDFCAVLFARDSSRPDQARPEKYSQSS